MYIYLSKKIAIPNGTALHSLSWNANKGWIACGGDSGLLKVLKLETGSKDAPGAGDVGVPRPRGVAAPSNLTMNQTLEGHDGAVVCVIWNAQHSKLTTSDQNGLIIVWMLHKGVWFEEMINNRNRSVVRGMNWTADGTKICIVYEDGHVIVGSVDGNRIWGKELDVGLRHVEWSPDGACLLFATSDASDALQLYNAEGNYLRSLPQYALEDLGPSRDATIIAVHWYNGLEGRVDPYAPSLAVAYSNGRVQVSRSASDAKPILIDTRMELTHCRWNTNGSVLALAGVEEARSSGGDRRAISKVQFYTPYGRHLRTLKVPGGRIKSMSCDGDGLRVALAVDAYIFFANMRPDYRWALLGGKTLVYAYAKGGRRDHSVVFWDTDTNDRRVQHREGVKQVLGAGESCCIVHLAPNAEAALAQHAAADVPEERMPHVATLCNAVGAPVDQRVVPLAPLRGAMTPFHVILANDRYVYVWQCRSAQTLNRPALGDQPDGAGASRALGRERIIDVERVESAPYRVLPDMALDYEPPGDPVTAVCASERVLYVARESGAILCYTLPHLALERRLQVRGRPAQLHLNCDSTRLAVIDMNGALSIADLTAAAREDGGATMLPFERRDAWDLKWSAEDADSFAVMEKTRLNMYSNYEAEEQQIASSAYLADYRDLSVTAVMMDEIMADPDPQRPHNDAVVQYEAKALRDARQVIHDAGLEEAVRRSDEAPHPRLHRLLAEAALEALDLDLAESAFARFGDYIGIQFCRRLKMLKEPMKQRAEVAAYFRRYDEAESIYREIDRKDLALELRMRTGDWLRVAQLAQSGGGDDVQLAAAFRELGEHHYGEGRYDAAAEFFQKSGDVERLGECLYRLGEFDALARVARSAPEDARLQSTFAERLMSVGLHLEAAHAYERCGMHKEAIDACVLLNHWDKAIELAERHGFPQIEGLLQRSAAQLVAKGQKLLAVELYRRANKATEAAKLVAAIAEDVGKGQVNPLLAKKLYVLAALEVERSRRNALDMSSAAAGDVAATTAATLNTLMTIDAESGSGGAGAKVLDNAWRGAEAYHYYLLAHRQLYAGDMDAAMRTAIRTAAFEDVLEPRDVYGLIALTAYHSRFFHVASRAFVKLETLPSVEEEQRSRFQDLAFAIFMRHAPVDPEPLPPELNRCLDSGVGFHACTLTGALIAGGRTVMCRVCRHHCMEAALGNRKTCPLCHAQLRVVRPGIKLAD